MLPKVVYWKDMVLTPRPWRQKGNVLFLILLAVVLFAALAMAMKSSMRGGGRDAKAEIDALSAATNQQCQALIENSVVRLQMLNDCTTEQISYELSDGRAANPLAPPNKKCHVFDAKGAGATPCGAWANPAASIPTGIIQLGDTTTIAMLSSGTYMTCPSWHSTYYCRIQVSSDGVNWRQACFEDGSATSTARQSNLMGFVYGFMDSACAAMCNGPRGYDESGPDSGPAYFVKDDLTLTEVTGSCTRYARRFSCDCF